MLHFAPRYGIISPCLHWGPSRNAVRPRALRMPRSVNDNDTVTKRRTRANTGVAQDDALLEAALRLFGAHGLSAAQRASEAAQIAAEGGDSAAAEWWIAVCAMLDGPLAKALQRRFAARASSQG